MMFLSNGVTFETTDKGVRVTPMEYEKLKNVDWYGLFKWLRQQFGVSVNRFSRVTRISRSTISGMQYTGTVPSPETIGKVVKGLATINETK